jgi:NAD(P)-dependent dehydrogenase (short-subunit alcohol dehydrogenase family)
MKLDNQVIVLLGAGLIGRTIINALHKKNSTIIVGDINVTPVKEWINNYCNNSNKNIQILEVDINSKKSIKNLIKIVSEEFGKIDAIVNSTYPRNKAYGKDFMKVKYEDFNENINLNLGSIFLVAKYFGKYFSKQGHGNIINFSSIYGVTAPKFDIYNGTKMTMPIEYAAIKSAIIHLTKYLATYFKNKNIKVNCISPGGILDNQPESFLKKYNQYCLNKGMLDKENLEGVVLFLLSEHSQYINGQNIIVDDGFTL